MGVGLGVPARVSKRRPEIIAQLRAFKAAVETYVEFPEITFTGDFRVGMLYNRATLPTGNERLLSSDGHDAIYINSSTGHPTLKGTALSDGSAVYFTGVGDVTGLELNYLEIERTGTQLSFRLNGSVLSSPDSSAIGPVTFKYISKAVYFDGIFARLDMEGSDVDPRQYSQFCRPDRIVPNELAQLGALIDLSVPFTLNAPWIQNGATFSINGLQSSPTTIFYSGVLTPHNTYLCQIKVSDWVSGSVRPENADIELSWASGDGAYEWAFTTAANANFNIQASSDFIGSVEFTLRDAPGYGVLYNPAEGSDQRHTKKNQAWNGTDLFAGNYLLNGGNPWIDNGDGSFTKVSGASYGQLALNNLEIAWHLISITVESVSNGIQVVRRNADGSYSNVGSVGVGRHVIPVEILGTGAPQFWFDGDDQGTAAVIRDIKVQKRIPIAPGAM